MTTLYLPSSGAAAISPAFDAAWNVSGSADRVAAVDAKSGTAMTSKAVPGSSVGGRNFLTRQYVYPLPAGVAFTTSDTVRGQIRAQEGSSLYNICAQCVIRVIAADATTVRATLVAADTSALSSEWATSLTNRTFPRGGAVNLATNYTTVSGDHLVLEVGGFQGAGSTNNQTLRFGDTGATDLPEDETTTADNVPWIRFSTDLAGAAPAATYCYLLF
jgi:hypothetical protein